LQTTLFFFAKLHYFRHFQPPAHADIAKFWPNNKPSGTAPMHLSADAPSDRGETRFMEMVFPAVSNHYGTLFGGNALELMGKAAFVAAARHARRNVVMASSDKIEFHEPIPVGELVELIARVERAGRSSMTVSVELIRESLMSGQRTSAVRGSFEMVAVNDHGRPIAIARDEQRNPITPPIN
jgi:acyl-CoA hydrolase